MVPTVAPITGTLLLILKVGFGSKILKFALENFLARFTKLFTDEENITQANKKYKYRMEIQQQAETSELIFEKTNTKCERGSA